MEHTEHLKKIKEMVGDFLEEIAETRRIDGSNVAVVKEAVSAYQKLCDLCDDAEGYGSRYGARRRDSRGRYMDNRPMNWNGGYGYYPGPYYDGAPDHGELASELENIAGSGGGNEAMKTALREAANWLRQN